LPIHAAGDTSLRDNLLCRQKVAGFPKSGKGTRVRVETDDKGVKHRVAVKSGERIPVPSKAKAAAS